MLTQGKYCKIVERHMEPMLRQLRAASSDIRYDGDLVYLSGTTPDSRRLEAIDIMLELTGGKPESFGGAGAPPPLLLRFSLGETDRRFFTVATLSSPGRTARREKTLTSTSTTKKLAAATPQETAR